MPLYMEFHKAVNLSMDDLKSRAAAGNRTLQQLQVRYHQFWIDEESGNVFCLMEGPDRGICEWVHRWIYGGEIVSLTAVKECLHHESSDINTESLVGNSALKSLRPILVAHLNTFALESHFDAADTDALTSLVKELIVSGGGTELTADDDHCIAAIFLTTEDALDCASRIQQTLITKRLFFSFHLIVMPVSREPIEVALIFPRQLCELGEDSTVTVSGHFKSSIKPERFLSLNTLTAAGEKFMKDLFVIVEEHISDDDFSVDTLARSVGISRPQLYRRIHLLTNRSPNIFIRDLRMGRALSLLRKRNKNISEVALEVGYTNPSYFARTFASKYGCTPSGYLVSLD
jgi:AraC-like DNA-binding protein